MASAGWKTFVFNTFLMFWGVLESLNYIDIVGEGYGPFVLIVVGAIGTVLRAVTKTPIFKTT